MVNYGGRKERYLGYLDICRVLESEIDLIFAQNEDQDTRKREIMDLVIKRKGCKRSMCKYYTHYIYHLKELFVEDAIMREWNKETE